MIFRTLGLLLLVITTASAEVVYLENTTRIPVPGRGPESIALDSMGFIYSGLSNGSIIRITPSSYEVEVIAHSKGVPLGIEFNSNGKLFVADANLGLLAVEKKGVRVLTNQSEGEKFRLTDDLAISKTGTIFFTDASNKYNVKQVMMEFRDQKPRGRLLAYSNAGSTFTLKDNLSFANGVALSPDETFLLICETKSREISRLWLSGPNQGKLEKVTEINGYPDNITIDSSGNYWVSVIHPNRNSELVGFRLSSDLEVMNEVRLPEGERIRGATSLLHKEGLIYIGSNVEKFITVAGIPKRWQ